MPVMTTIQINIPYSMLLQRIDFVMEHRLHPEIYFSAEDLDAYQKGEGKELAEALQRSGLE
ncbi:MAG: hypothetical protein MUO28_02255, partial [Desulfobacterales bacterium]|nr:hypothetical protein [Desulfobacterales bacterium]